MPDDTSPANHDAEQVQNAPSLQDAKTHPSVTTLGQQIIDAMRGLNTIVQIALAEDAAQYEARQQLSLLAHSLGSLASQSLHELPRESNLKTAWYSLSSELGSFVIRETPAADSDEDKEVADDVGEAEPLSDEEVSRRLGIEEPVYHSETPASKDLRRVLVASLESQNDTAMLVSLAANSFSRETWQVTNLGANVPIMALTGIVMDSRPSVLVLIVGQGQLLSETARLVIDLKRQLFGLRIIAVGPVLSQSSLASRLQLDLFSSSPEKAAELADQFFNPLTKLGDRLQLSLDMDETEMLPGFEAEPEADELKPFEPEAEG